MSQPFEYTSERRRLISAIKKIVKPHLYPCGYVDHNEKDGRLKMACFENVKYRKLAHGFVLIEFGGFTKNGIITDDCAGAIVWTGYNLFPIEDLYRLYNSLASRPPKWYTL